MNNDTLIDQARHLYARLHIEQYALSTENKTRFERLDYLVIQAFCRYKRRLNRCVLCYQHRLQDCPREILSKARKSCPRRLHDSTESGNTTLIA